MEFGGMDFFLGEIEEIRDIVKGMELEVSSEYEEEDQEGEPEEEYSESLEGDLKEYQERFRKYVESLEKEIRSLYRERGDEPREGYAENGEKVKTPWERGHKLGCGCPGCSAYRESHGIELGKNQNSDLKFPDLRFGSKKSERREEYQESGSKPCGGKHYHFFHGKRSEFKRLLGNYARKLNLNLAGY
ncbi:MAG: hypothetical protein GTN38_02290 [Candidatus Aenigmarchaeota archaeon]|nr:hypothetical protein [Candidatus Aenigmarchaeota archaeon]NIP40382.1 hypothetical protein [Candidatus Aenigmarchaeota archaeon]NIQ18308.1 hypothetical protein [Candidatus Aenigmarchaeota archaeon]NIS73260.1 hypothetical protein [Candidatus Aenigmarchaeota archaeon]